MNAFDRCACLVWLVACVLSALFVHDLFLTLWFQYVAGACVLAIQIIEAAETDGKVPPLGFPVFAGAVWPLLLVMAILKGWKKVNR